MNKEDDRERIIKDIKTFGKILTAVWATITILGIIFIMPGCTKTIDEIECNQVCQRVENNHDEARAKCMGLANSYPEMTIISDIFLSSDCDLFEESEIIEVNYWCGSVEFTEVTTTYYK